MVLTLTCPMIFVLSKIGSFVHFFRNSEFRILILPFCNLFTNFEMCCVRNISQSIRTEMDVYFLLSPFTSSTSFCEIHFKITNNKIFLRKNTTIEKCIQISNNFTKWQSCPKNLEPICWSTRKLRKLLKPTKEKV